MKLYMYLNYGGNCEQAFRFYEQHLGGKITAMMRREQEPGAGTLQYARMTIGETELMAADVPEGFQPMRSAYLYLALESVAEAERVWALLSDGGTVFMPIAETFFAVRFGMLRDRFGTSWMVIHERPQP